MSVYQNQSLTETGLVEEIDHNSFVASSSLNIFFFKRIQLIFIRENGFNINTSEANSEQESHNDDH